MNTFIIRQLDVFNCRIFYKQETMMTILKFKKNNNINNFSNSIAQDNSLPKKFDNDIIQSDESLNNALKLLKQPK